MFQGRLQREIRDKCKLVNNQKINVIETRIAPLIEMNVPMGPGWVGGGWTYNLKANPFSLHSV